MDKEEQSKKTVTGAQKRVGKITSDFSKCFWCSITASLNQSFWRVCWQMYHVISARLKQKLIKKNIGKERKAAFTVT